MPTQPPKPKKCPRCQGRKKYNHRMCMLCRGTGQHPAKTILHNSLVHVAGTVFRCEGRVIQRCAVCGVKVVDSAEAPPILDDKGKPVDTKVWVAGDFVELVPRVINTPERLVFVGHWNTDPAPVNFCLELVELSDR